MIRPPKALLRRAAQAVPVAANQPRVAEATAFPSPGGAVQPMRLGWIVAAGAAVIALFFLVFGGWAATVELDSAAVAKGIVSVEGSRKSIQHLEGGIVRAILVHDGDHVKKDQVLVRLDDTKAQANLDLLRSRRVVAAAHVAELVAERDRRDRIAFPAWLVHEKGRNRTVDDVIAAETNIFGARHKALLDQTSILKQQIAQLNEEITGFEGQIGAEDRQLMLVREEAQDVRTLYDKGLAEKTKLLALERTAAKIEGSRAENVAGIARARQSIGEAQYKINALATDQVNKAVDEMQKVQAQLFDIEQQLRAARDVMRRTAIRSPLDGIVVDQQIHTTGGVIQPGQTLMEIVPTRDMRIVEAKVSPNDIEYVHPGLPARVELLSVSYRYQYQLKAVVNTVSADRLVDPHTGASYYLADVEIRDEKDEKREDVDLYPGMPAEVMILTGKRTALNYLMQPLRLSFERAMREK